MFILDLVTAIKVSVEFGREAYNVVFGLTLCLILVPLFLVSVLSTVQTFQHPLAFETVARQLDFKDLGLYLLPVLSTIFPRFVQEFMLWKRSYLKNSPACANYEACHCMRCIQYREFNKSRYDFLWIHYIHAILSSAPRYCLQVYIVLRQWNFPLYTVVSVVLSLLYLSWSITGPLLRICNWVGHLSQGTKNNVKRGPEKNRNFEKSKNRKIEKIEKSKFCRSKFPI